MAFYGDARIRLCKVQFNKRTIVLVSAWFRHVQATLCFPDRYINDLYGLHISNELLESIKNAINTGKSKQRIFKLANSDDSIDFTGIMHFKPMAER